MVQISVLLCSYLKTSEIVLLGRQDAEAWTWQSSFVARYEKSEKSFFAATGEVSAHLYTSSGSRFCILYSGARKRVLRKAFGMEKLDATPSLVFVNNGHVELAASQWREKQRIWYHSSVAPDSFDLPDAIAFAYDSGIF